MTYGWKESVLMLEPLMGGGDGVCGRGFMMTELVMITCNENACI